ncbi:MAG: hypothetical protein ACRC33_15655, partial [Gemmataceae bacterium]
AGRWARRHPAWAAGCGVLALLLAARPAVAGRERQHGLALTRERDQADAAYAEVVEALIHVGEGTTPAGRFGPSLDAVIGHLSADPARLDRDPGRRLRLAQALHYRARLPHDEGGADAPLGDAEMAAYRRAAAEFARLEGDPVHGPTAALVGANTCNNLGNACRAGRRWADARRWYGEAIGRFERRIGGGDPRPVLRLFLGNALGNRARAELREAEDRPAARQEARADSDRALKSYDEAFAADPSLHEAFAWLHQKDLETAVDVAEGDGPGPHRAAVARWIDACGPAPEPRYAACVRLARAYGRWRQEEDAALAVAWMSHLRGLGYLTPERLKEPAFGSLCQR